MSAVTETHALLSRRSPSRRVKNRIYTGNNTEISSGTDVRSDVRMQGRAHEEFDNRVNQPINSPIRLRDERAVEINKSGHLMLLAAQNIA